MQPTALSFSILPIDPVNLVDLKICINSLSKRREEGVFAESCEQAELLQLILYRVFHFGKAELDAGGMQSVIELAECVGGSDIDAGHRLCRHHNPTRGRRCTCD